ncbi:MAG: PaaI family thioesterase [Candidatus Rokubacteria bacterium]|nr:PaaI family thioesterase [Candidatus Rokubacteria bacterium]
MSLAVTESQLGELLSSVAFTRSYGFRLHSIAEGRCTIAVPFQEAFERPGQIVSGQVFMAAADVAMWFAIMTRLGIADTSVTAGMTTSFLAPARREDFRCAATILRLGKRLVYGVAECVNGHGTLLTHHAITYIRSSA